MHPVAHVKSTVSRKGNCRHPLRVAIIPIDATSLLLAIDPRPHPQCDLTRLKSIAQSLRRVRSLNLAPQPQTPSLYWTLPNHITVKARLLMACLPAPYAMAKHCYQAIPRTINALLRHSMDLCFHPVTSPIQYGFWPRYSLHPAHKHG